MVLALSVSAWSVTVQGAARQSPAGERQTAKSSETDRSGDRDRGAGFHMLPERAVEGLKLTEEQKKQLAELRTEAKEKFEKILTPEQVEKLQKLREQRERFGRGMGGPAMRGQAMRRFGMGAPGMRGGSMGGFGMRGPGMAGPGMGRFGMGAPGRGQGMGGFGMGGPGMAGPGMGRFGMGAPGMRGGGMGGFGMGPQAGRPPFRDGQQFDGPRRFRGPRPDGGADKDTKPQPKSEKE